MSFVGRSLATLAASMLLLAAGRASAAGGGTFGAAKAGGPEAAEPAAGFEALRKPEIPMIFLAHNGGWVQFQYPPSARDRVAPVTAQADDLRAELAEDLGQPPLDGVEIRVARGLEEMGTLAPQNVPPPPHATSVSYPKLKLIVLSLASGGATEPVDLRESFRRELARLALADAVAARPIPGWLAEGFVEHFVRPDAWSTEWVLYRASIRHGMHALAELDAVLSEGGSEASLAAAEASDFVGFLLKAERRAEFAGAIERLRQGDSLESALASAYGSGLPSLERRWRTDRTRWTTLITVSLAIGLPGLALLAWSVARSVRRRRGSGREVEGRVKRAASSGDGGRVHIVLSRRDERLEAPVIAETEVPRVEHEGEWHTLH